MNLKDWLNRGKGAVRATGRAVQTAFDPNTFNRLGTALGNQISRSKRAESIVNTIGQRGGERAARIMRDVSGVRNYQEAARDFGKGNVAGGLFNLGEGALDTLSTATGMRGGVMAARAARAGGQRLLPSVAKGVTTGVFRDPLGTRIVGASRGKSLPTRLGAAGLSAVIPGSLVGRGVERNLDPYGRAADYVGKLTGRISGQSPASTSGRTADQWERILGGGGTPATAKPPYWDAEGRYHVYNPRTGIYEVTSLRDTETPTTPGGAGTPAAEDAVTTPAAGGAFTVPGGDMGAGMYGALPYEEGMAPMSGMSQGSEGASRAGSQYSQELAALSPEEMQELLEASRDAQRQYDEIINQMGRTTAETERDFFDYTRGVNRQVAGGRQNVASQLAQLGMDTSPATQAYADYLGAQGQRQIASGRANVAKILADLRGQRGTAEANKLRRMREIDMAMRNARARRTTDRVQR